MARLRVCWPKAAIFCAFLGVRFLMEGRRRPSGGIKYIDRCAERAPFGRCWPEAAGRLLPLDGGTSLDSRRHLAGTRRRAMTQSCRFEARLLECPSCFIRPSGRP
jgi:hypothetical protein